MKAVFSKNKPEKSLITILKKHSGRDSAGHVSVRHQGGRRKRYYRLIDFKRTKRGIEGKVVDIQYDPNRNAHIALVQYSDGEKRYILHPKDLLVGASIIASDDADVKPGNALPLKKIPIGFLVHNVELLPGQGGQIVRGAGTAASIIGKDETHVHIKLPSGEVRRFMNDCYATIGMVGNIAHKDEIIGSAGRKRRMGIRPTVRGVAQNPRSHPHGGGEGKSGTGMHPKTPWGKPAHGKRTRNKNKSSGAFIMKRRA